MEQDSKQRLQDIYQDPLTARYASKEMSHLFSDNFKYHTWRKCWTVLAETQHELGLNQITSEMVREMKKAQNEPIDYDLVEQKEKELRHDVMAHLYEFATHCPTAKPIIHLGATSQFVGCNTDLIQQREAIKLVKTGLTNTVYHLSKFAKQHAGLVTLSYTHFQPAQPTTIGKRTTLYLQDLIYDLGQIESMEPLIQARGAKGTVGTQATYLELFTGDYEKVKKLDKLVAKKLGFESTLPITGQTYSRKLDALLVKSLAGIGESAHKFAVDLRLLSNLKVLEEPFAKNQTGSSAMAYKRNPMRSERMTGLSRKLINLQHDFSHTHANQWLERSLDDSVLRRMSLPQAYLLTDAILNLYQNISARMVVYPAQIKKHLEEELPFMMTEKILMDLSKQGYDRQEMHEIIKQHSLKAGKIVKEKGEKNDLIKRLAQDSNIPFNEQYFLNLLDSPEQFSGAAEVQTKEYLENIIFPVLEKYRELIKKENTDVEV